MYPNGCKRCSRSIQETLAYADGTADTSRYGVHVPADIDVKAIRTKLDMTQEEFAKHLNERKLYTTPART
jgi:DNA-binding transcriptional regulator YiaG